MPESRNSTESSQILSTSIIGEYVKVFKSTPLTYSLWSGVGTEYPMGSWGVQWWGECLSLLILLLPTTTSTLSIISGI